MQRMVIGILVGAGLAMLASSAWTAPDVMLAPGHRSGSDMIAFSSQLADGRTQMTLIDTRQRVLSVYHIDPSKGEVALRSVRNISWDLRMTQFNGVSPLPQEIRSLLEQK